MAEIKSTIKQKEFRKGYYIELNCPYCYREVMLGAETKKELSEEIKKEGWKWLNSDFYGQVGYWCGCSYRD